MAAYYNEFEPYAAEWLRNLIKAGLIPDGEVDTRSIVDVSADDLRAFSQCHFFAGIGGWAHALRLAGWPDDRPIWTGSCPCQPFSVAGKGLGADDPRHLWPHFFRLISAARPPVVMGEQVAGAAGYGWLDGVAADLESENYASRAVDVPACAVDAPHIRSRLYWVASDMGNANRAGGASRIVVASRAEARSGQFVGAGVRSDMADAQIIRREERERKDGQQDARSGCKGGMDVAGTVEGLMDDADNTRLEGHTGNEPRAAQGWGEPRRSAAASGVRSDMADATEIGRRRWSPSSRQQAGGDAGVEGSSETFWSNAIWLTGADGKARRAEPTIPLLAHGVPARVGRLRAYGNAIVPQVAAEVIRAYMEAAQ